MNKLPAFTRGTYLYNVNISAPIHYFYFISEDHGNEDRDKILRSFDKILYSNIYMSSSKFLLVYHQTKKSDQPIISILEYAKTKNFIDFVILQVIKNKPPTLYRKNFIPAMIERQTNMSRVLKLFPDNNNMAGYNLRVGITQRWSFLKENPEGYPAHLVPHSRVDKFYQYFSEYVNVTTKFVVVNSYKRMESIRKQNLEMVLFGNDIVLGTGTFNHIYILRYSKVVSVVPLIDNTEITGSESNFRSFVDLLVIIIGIFLFFKYSI